ncbi:hypothetical protein HG536_0D00620 [Torulaspora globosa]|uniref:Histone chaperone RTT106 n=1 Tax=Torulaspora globosa TaxID=48254 RepID=A0A7G3ZGA4_9SACH|nr:uncharacterized protein HG536_0D00620 [Torulaspora globosa]QLL32540.1 hypothetical protein HG536_0D00620 [Torulaspora globosa]
MDPFLEKLPDELRSKVIGVVNIVPESLPVFEQLYMHASENADQARKVRKLDGEEGQLENTAPDKNQIIFSIKDASVLSPIRKKLNFILHLSPQTGKPMLSLLKNGKPELTIKDLRTNIKMATFLPVAEKQNYIYIFISYENSVSGKYTEPILMTLNKNALLEQFKESGLLDSSVDDFSNCVEYMRKQAILAGFRISDPFFSSQRAANESFHVECHRGTKEGTLYFLPDHLIFGFKKPILLFQSVDIEAITYSSITRLTFNVTLITKGEQKFEFSMIDQNEFAKIDEYVKRKQVKDKSMSAELKAKSKSKGGQQNNEGDNVPSALEEAAQQMENEATAPNIRLGSDDDEEDENFEGESDLSDGSGVESEAEENGEDIELNGAERDDVLSDNRQFAVENEQSQTVGSTADIGLEDIPIEVDDDEEGSGVEYG